MVFLFLATPNPVVHKVICENINHRVVWSFDRRQMDQSHNVKCENQRICGHWKPHTHLLP
jgi:hypothetical protein